MKMKKIRFIETENGVYKVIKEYTKAEKIFYSVAVLLLAIFNAFFIGALI